MDLLYRYCLTRRVNNKNEGAIMTKRKVIIVTDGDRRARRTIEWATHQIGGRCISMSAGNPTPIDGNQIVDLIKQTPHDPVVVMVDDRGVSDFGVGERALEVVAKHPDIDVLGVLAVASNTECLEGIHVDASIDKYGKFVDLPVDKSGKREVPGNIILEGDTVDIINHLNIPIIIGIGDIGKMDGADDILYGSPITLKALKEILKRSGFEDG